MYLLYLKLKSKNKIHMLFDCIIKLIYLSIIDHLNTADQLIVRIAYWCTFKTQTHDESLSEKELSLIVIGYFPGTLSFSPNY